MGPRKVLWDADARLRPCWVREAVPTPDSPDMFMMECPLRRKWTALCAGMVKHPLMPLAKY